MIGNVKDKIRQWLLKKAIRAALARMAKQTEGSEMIGWLRGKKTYITGVAWILWGAWMYFVLGQHSEGAQRIMEGFSLIFLRAGVAKAANSK